MPGNSGSSIMTPYNASLSERESTILTAGINLFEIKPRRIQFFGDRIFGPWDVNIRELIGANNQLQQSVRWHSKRSAYVECRHFGKGKRFGWVPDDPYWHNRIQLIYLVLGNNPAYQLLRYHTPEGSIPANRLLQELVYLRDQTHQWTVVDRQTKEVLFKSIEGTEADRFVANAVQDGKPEAKRMMLAFTLSDEIKPLVQEYSTQWIFQEKWTREILPRIKSELQDTYGTSHIEEERERALKLFPELRQLRELVSMPEIRKILQGQQIDVLPSEPVEEIKLINTDEEITIPTDKALVDLTAAQLRVIARDQFNIKNSAKMSKEAIIMAINELQGTGDQVSDDDQLSADDISIEE